MSKDLSKRIFGSPIDSDIALKLKARQQVAEFGSSVDEIKHGNQIHSTREILKDSINSPSELGSRTPWVRAWCAVELYKTTAGEEGYTTYDEETASTWWGGVKRSYTAVQNKGKPGFEQSFDRKVYILGDNNFNQFQKENIYDPIQSDFDNWSSKNAGSSESEYNAANAAANEVFKDPLENNQYLKPGAGITSISSTTEGPFGAIKRTTVEFIVHSFDDFQNIYSRFFLKPGATIVVDWGWNTVKPYNPMDVVDGDYNLRDIVFGTKNKPGYLDKHAGDAETIVGKVVKFDSSVDERGSFSCKLEIVSDNAALLGQEVSKENKLREKMVENLGTYVINRVASFVGKAFLRSNWTTDAESVEESKMYAYTFAHKFLAGSNSVKRIDAFDTTVIPNSAVKLGVYWQASIAETGDTSTISSDSQVTDYRGINSYVNLPIGDDNNIFVSWAFFEEELLNNKLSMVSPKNKNGGRFDSGNAFISYNSDLIERQKNSELYSKAKTGFSFLYPDKWDDTYNTIQHPDKVPSRKLTTTTGYSEDVLFEDDILQESYEGIGTYETSHSSTITDNDKLKYKRIPLREIFINIRIIKEAFSGSDSVNDALSKILELLNDDSLGVFDLKTVSTSKDNSIITIVDQNYINSQNDKDTKEEVDNNLFTFHPFTKGSIVKSINLTFQTPQNALQSMIAIQNTSVSIPLFPLTKTEAQNNVMRVLENYLDDNQDFGIRHLPIPDKDQRSFESVGDADASSGYISVDPEINLLEDNAPTNIQKHYEGLTVYNYKHASDTRNSELTPDPNDLDTLYHGLYDDYYYKDEDDDNKVVDTTEVESGEPPDTILPGRIYAKDLEEYYMYKIKGTYVNKKVSTIIPIDLSLDTYGISGILPGNIFNVSYLPERYRKRVYFQTKKVSQKISTDGWTTTIEAIMRMRSLEEVLPKADLNRIVRDINNKLYMSSNWIKSVGVDATIRKYFDQFKFIGSYGDGAVLEFRATAKMTKDNFNMWKFFGKAYNHQELNFLVTGNFQLDENHLPPSYVGYKGKFNFVSGKYNDSQKYLEKRVSFKKDKEYTIFVAYRGGYPITRTSGPGSKNKVRKALAGLVTYTSGNLNLPPWRSRDFNNEESG